MDFSNISKDISKNVPHKAGRYLDLRNQQTFKNFNAHKYTFRFRPQAHIELDVHSTTTQSDIDFYDDYLANILKEAGRAFQRNGVSLDGIIQIFLQAPGLDHAFEWGAGIDRIFLGELLYNDDAMQEILDKIGRAHV